MRSRFFALLAAVALGACSFTPPEGADRNVEFACMNGESISILFSPSKGTAVMTRNGQGIELQQQPSGSGFAYSNGPNTIRGKGNELTVNIGRMVPIQCKAR